MMGRWAGEDSLGLAFSVLAGVVLIALLSQIIFLKPKCVDMKVQDFR